MYLFSGWLSAVAAAILAAVEGGILPPGAEVRNGGGFSNHTPIPPGRMPGSTADKMPAATLNGYALTECRYSRFGRCQDSGRLDRLPPRRHVPADGPYRGRSK